MSQDKPLFYLIATISGFVTYLVLNAVFGVEYSYALFFGFVGAHAGLLLSRRFLS